MVSSKLVCLLLSCVLAFNLLTSAIAIDVSHDGRAITIDGKRRVLLSGSIHYTRSTAQMWPDLIKKAKEGGLDAIETYVFWNVHEPSRRQYDFTGDLDLVRFIKTIQDEGFYAVLRIGPYICGEWNYGGLPMWLHNLPGVEFRTANDVFMNEMQNFTSLIINMMRREKLFASQGGPIILAQIENEYGNIMSSYGDAGKTYINWAAKMAETFNIGVPWIMCQQSDAPRPMINTCNGWYCHDFEPNNPNSPKMWTENWTGWFKNWGGPDPHRTAEDVAFAVARFFQTGGTFQNYYMYHGGTNFGRTAGGPYITTSYDYDAPLDEYGNLNQPKYSHLKQLHDVLHSIEDTLTHGNISTIAYGNSVTVTQYKTENVSSCFFGNSNSTVDATINFQGTQYTVPAWSVSILPDCKTETYNTAKVNVQTSLMVKKPNTAEDELTSLKWQWRSENINSFVLHGKGQMTKAEILDQNTAANDASDYLWYMTTLNLEKDDPIWSNNMSIRINGTGYILHAYVNGEHIGSQWAMDGVTNFVFEEKVKLNRGNNLVSLLSATVGFFNYGYKYDSRQIGIVGPIQIISKKSDETIIKDLSKHQWKYKVGLQGLNNKYYNLKNEQNGLIDAWTNSDLPTNKTFTWYKTTFSSPVGTDPIVLDLQGMGKGLAWINGHCIGRYWPSYLAQEDGCSSEACDYRGPYDNNKCISNCGKPTQRWYHVPRSYLNNGENSLVLLEEFGGNPGSVNFQTITVGSVCGNAYENNTLTLSCQGRPISKIRFASFGDPKGTCGAFEKGSCGGSKDTLTIVQQACVGKESCSVEVSEKTFGSANCGSNIKRLAVEAVC